MLAYLGAAASPLLQEREGMRSYERLWAIALCAPLAVACGTSGTTGDGDGGSPAAVDGAVSGGPDAASGGVPDGMVTVGPDGASSVADGPLATGADAPLGTADAPLGTEDAPAAGGPDASATGSTDAPATGGTDAATTGSTDAPATGSTDAPAAGSTDAPAGNPDARVTPGAPTGVLAGADITLGAIVEWDAPSDIGMSSITGYIVKADCGGDVVIQNADTTRTYQFSLSSVAAGTMCTFTVQAVNSGGAGAESAPSPAVTLADGPQPPTIVACGGQGRVFLSLGGAAQAGVTGYAIYRGTQTGVTKLNPAYGFGASAMPVTDDTGLTNGTTYYYTVAARNAAGILSLESNEVTATPQSTFQDVLIAAGQMDVIHITDCLSQVPNGATRVTRKISGDQTQMVGNLGIADVFLDGINNVLYVTTAATPKVLVWDNAGSVDGNVAPTRNISGNNTGLVQPRGVFMDVSSNRLYVADYGDNSIRIWNNGSTVDGNVKPSAVLKGVTSTLNNPSELFVHETADTLWVANGPNVLVFGNASTITSANADKTAPSRTLTFHTTTLLGLWMETSDNRMFVSARNTNGTIYEVANAGSANGSQDPADATLVGASLDNAGPVQIRQGTLYEINVLGNNLHIYENAKTLNGMVSPTKTVGLGTPNGVGFAVLPPP
jgi:hypothetical protein